LGVWDKKKDSSNYKSRGKKATETGLVRCHLYASKIEEATDGGRHRTAAAGWISSHAASPHAAGFV
jgi:uncharacterized DUF497 family protein